MKNEKNRYYILMTMLVFVWGLDYIIAKLALNTLEPLILIFFKYLASFVLIAGIKIKTDGMRMARKKDIGLFVLSILAGEIIYYYCEYKAMDYLPVSLLAIITAFVPAVSVMIERVLYKKKANRKIIIGIMVCIFGIALIIGVDFDDLLSGKLIGYLLAFGCICAWNAYNFITAALNDRYTPATLALNQIIGTLLFLSPVIIHSIPDLPVFTPTLIAQIVFLGFFNSGIGFLIMVRALYVLGPTATVLFSEFTPVVTTFFGWLILKEAISPIQMAGGAIVILAGYIVIKEKGKVEELSVE